MPTSPKMFRPAGSPTKQEQTKDYESWRGSARERGYGVAWEKSSASFRRSHPLCLGCEAAGFVVPTELVDHVDPHRGDMAKFWKSDRWQSSCRWHHDVVKSRLELMWDRGDIGLDDLWLNSAVALALAARLRRGVGVG